MHYVMHYPNVCKKESWRVRNTEKQGEGEIYSKMQSDSLVVEVEIWDLCLPVTNGYLYDL